MSKHVEIKLDPITDGIIDDMVRENVHCTDRHPRIIATNGRDRITDCWSPGIRAPRPE